MPASSQRNQYLSEYALHRSLLQYEHRVRDPHAADFLFVPFYARLAYADKKATKGAKDKTKTKTKTKKPSKRAAVAAGRGVVGMGAAIVAAARRGGGVHLEAVRSAPGKSATAKARESAIGAPLESPDARGSSPRLRPALCCARARSTRRARCK